MLLSRSNVCDNYIAPLVFLSTLIPFLNKFIPYDEINKKIKDMINKTNDYVSVSIPSHEVPIIIGLSMSSPHTKIIYSTDFLAIIFYLNRHKIDNIESTTEIMACNSELNIRAIFEDKKKENSFIYIPLGNNKVLISEEDNIYFEFKNVDNKSDNESDEKKTKTVKKKNFVIILSIHKKYKNGMDLLQKFIKKCREEYTLFLNSNKDNDSQYLYVYKKCEKSDSSLDLVFDKFLMEHNKDILTNIFFEGKDQLINYINPFIYNPHERFNIGEEKYKRSGFTFKAGILFYGTPGCGKTSTIKAILKYTKRHGIIINLNRVKTCEELETIFRNRKINDKEMNGKELCYILEDCDAFGDSIIKSRVEEDVKMSHVEIDLAQIAKIIESGSSISGPVHKKEEDAVNLSCFLNILDGIIELHGVMIIMTTNHPEKIDQALIRPGRFDFKYEFKRASKKVIKEMLEHKFELSKEEIDMYTKHMNIKDEILSPAEVQSICFKYNDVKKAIDDIIIACQKT
jgi:hypothetical protein